MVLLLYVVPNSKGEGQELQNEREIGYGNSVLSHSVRRCYNGYPTCIIIRAKKGVWRR